ncbi:MAG: hypothetical protein IJH60_06975, partial [Eubacterium sp.]|nr:hypothetical protein [Eubacterium sp.]
MSIRKKITALTLTLMMLFSLVPFTASVKAASKITVNLTISDEGKLTKANDGSIMAWKKISVTDLNSDGKFTVDEALVAAHKLYNTEKGYALNGSMVSTFWGKPTSGLLFFINGNGLTTGVTTDTVSEGDDLVAAILTDTTNWSDWYTVFS